MKVTKVSHALTWYVTFFDWRMSALSWKTNYSSENDKNVKCLSPTPFPIIHLTYAYRSRGIHLACVSMWGKSFCTNEMIYFAAFKGFPETLIFISQMGKKGENQDNTELKVSLENVALNEQDTMLCLGSVSPGDNACSVNYGGCTTLCLAIPGGRVCACADNQVLEKNNVTCAGRRT